ncbi:uncharacterized protein LOC135226590 [Macrobrachium nipponense]|uniref:uncharacterized protein LOC135226590 n=1 Tax=Macrobrachium nipponense TaxID=159736 RepID=UPI0030C7C167
MKVLHLAFSALLLTALAKGRTLKQEARSFHMKIHPLDGRTAELGTFYGHSSPISTAETLKYVRSSSFSNESVPEESSSDGIGHQCTKSGDFPVPASCRLFYRCEERGRRNSGEYAIQLRFCPDGTMFSKSTSSCVLPTAESQGQGCLMQWPEKLSFDVELDDLLDSRWTENSFEPYRQIERVKRLDPALLFSGVLAVSSVVSTANQLFKSSHFQLVGGGVGARLNDVESKLSGMEAKLQGISLSVRKNEISNKMYSEMTNYLITSAIKGNQFNFDVTRKLINKGFLENRINTAALQGLIIHGNAKSAVNFAKIQVSISELKEFITAEIEETKTTLQKGFESIPEIIDKAKLQTLASDILIAIQGFHEKLNHLESLPEKSRKDEIEKPKGYLEYLESTELQDILNQVIQQQYAIPREASDLSAVFTLDLLVHGLQVYTHMLSSIVSSNAFLASKALEELQLEGFNTYMQRVHSAVERVKIVLGYGETEGLIAKIKQVLSEAQLLPYVSHIRGFTELLSEKFADLKKLEKDIEEIISRNKALPTPGSITGKPLFSHSSPSAPIGPWVTGKKVSYAIQLVSENGLSSVGAWSTPYEIDGKVCPTIKLPQAETGVIRFLYRKFDHKEKPELVAIVRNNLETSVRDINRDILNAAASPNEDIAIRDITALASDPATDINFSLENQLTPLHYAAKQGNTKVMEFLIGKNANVKAKTNDNQQPLHFAALFGGKEGIGYLIGKGAEVNAQTSSLGLSPLHIAVANDHVEATQALIEKGAVTNIKDNSGLTPLHMAVAGNGDTIDILLQDDNLDLNAAAEHGLTPLHYAARSYSESAVQKLLEADGIDVNAKSEALLTPIHFAAMGGNADIITDLKKKGASLSAADKYGSTALHYAAFYGNKEAFLLMIVLEPSLKDAMNTAGETARRIAEQNKGQQVMDILNSNKTTLTDMFKEVFLGKRPAAAPADDDLSQEKCPDNGKVSEILTSAEEICPRVAHIDTYVNLITSMIPLKVYYERYEEYHDIFDSYDKDLQAAQQHAFMWRNGDSIVSNIIKTFKLAKHFEPEFNRKYKINKRIIKEIKLSRNEQVRIKEITQEITSANEQLALATKGYNAALEKAPDMAPFFQASINSNTERIRKLTEEMNKNYTLAQKLKETASFLKFVKRDSEKIQSIAEKTKNKSESFRDYLLKDKTAFERQGGIARNTLADIEKRTKQKNEYLDTLKAERLRLESLTEQERVEINDRYSTILKAQAELTEAKKQLRAKIHNARVKKIWGAVLTPLLIGIPLLIAGTTEEKSLVETLEDTIQQSAQQIEFLQREIAARDTEIKRLGAMILDAADKTDNVINDFHSFIILDADLNTIIFNTDMILKAIGKAIDGASVIQDLYRHVTTKLEEMIDLATTAKTDAEMIEVDSFIYNGLSQLSCNWRSVYSAVGSLHECISEYRFMVLGRSHTSVPDS